MAEGEAQDSGGDFADNLIDPVGAPAHDRVGSDSAGEAVVTTAPERQHLPLSRHPLQGRGPAESGGVRTSGVWFEDQKFPPHRSPTRPTFALDQGAGAPCGRRTRWPQAPPLRRYVG